MAAFFLLIITFVVPDERNRDTFFSQMEIVDKKGNGKNGLKWYRRLSIGVLQWIPMSIILWIATIISEAAGTYCSTSNKPYFAHIWITLIRMFCTLMAIASILHFYGKSKPALKPKGALRKLVCFKVLVTLNFLQSFIFNFLKSNQDIHPTKYMIYDDIYNGLPSLILCCELALISSFFWFAYPVSPYLVSRQTPISASGDARPWSYQGGPGGMYAILEAIDVLDIAKEMVRAATAKGNGDFNRGGNEMESGASSLEPMVPPPRYEGGGAGDEQVLEYSEPQYQSRRGLRGGRHGRRERRLQYRCSLTD